VGENQTAANRERNPPKKMVLDLLYPPENSITRQVPTSDSQSKRKRGRPETPGDETWRQNPRKWDCHVDNWRNWPRTGTVGELLLMAYVPNGTRGKWWWWDYLCCFILFIFQYFKYW